MAKLAGFLVALLACALVACSGQVAGPSSDPTRTVLLPAIDGDLAVTAVLPPKTIGEELPSEGLGTVRSVKWGAKVGGFTQHSLSEVLGFPPGTKITIRNLSTVNEHTLDVVEVVTGTTIRFPKHPSLPFTASGGHLRKGYASGIIKPGHSVTVVLEKGVYIIGCAFHYSQGMRDILVVEDGAKPGPQATPTPVPDRKSVV